MTSTCTCTCNNYISKVETIQQDIFEVDNIIIMYIVGNFEDI